ncbi:MAG: low affinity iron permease family protein [Thermoanaerobaculia bacterium]
MGEALERFSYSATRWTGSSMAFGMAATVILVWLLSGPLFHYSDTWQLVINTSTTIVTFLMVFLIQRAQNKDALAIHLKLNELVAAMEGASNRLVDVEEISEDELRALQKYYKTLACMVEKEHTLTQSHSIEEAQVRHARKEKGHGHSTSEAALEKAPKGGRKRPPENAG